MRGAESGVSINVLVTKIGLPCSKKRGIADRCYAFARVFVTISRQGNLDAYFGGWCVCGGRYAALRNLELMPGCFCMLNLLSVSATFLVPVCPATPFFRHRLCPYCGHGKNPLQIIRCAMLRIRTVSRSAAAAALTGGGPVLVGSIADWPCDLAKEADWTRQGAAARRKPRDPFAAGKHRLESRQASASRSRCGTAKGGARRPSQASQTAKLRAGHLLALQWIRARVAAGLTLSPGWTCR